MVGFGTIVLGLRVDEEGCGVENNEFRDCWRKEKSHGKNAYIETMHGGRERSFMTHECMYNHSRYSQAMLT